MSEFPGQPAPHDGPMVGETNADLGTRVIAKLIDYVILYVLVIFIVIPIALTSVITGPALSGGFSFSGTALLIGLVTYGIYLAYFVGLEMTTGQTLGKMMLKIRVRGASGAKPDFQTALKRNAWMFVGIVPLLGFFAFIAAAIYIIVTINNNETTRQGWHDQFAGGTSVIKAG